MTTRQQAIAAFTGPGRPHELADEVVQGRALRVFLNAPQSLRALFESTASPMPFLSYQDEHWSFAQAWESASRIGHVLVHECGVRQGDRVAIAMRNYPEWVLAFTAVTSIGAIAVAMNAHWQADEMGYALSDSGARVLLADQERLSRLTSAPPGLQVLAVRPALPLAPGVRLLATLTDAAPAVMPPSDIAQDDAATILYTSGSTGHPKGVVSSHRNILASLLSWELDRLVGDAVAGIAPPAPGDPLLDQPGTLLAVPLFHVTGLHASFLSSYRTQRRMVCMYRWDVQAAAALIDAKRLTSMVAPAAMSGDLVRVAQSKAYNLSSLLALGGGGAPRAPEQVGQIAASFQNALPGTGWGMTETNAIGTGIGGQDYLDHPESSGRCSQVMQLKIIDETGQEMPTGQRGELLVRGTALFSGYWNQPEVTAKSFMGDWFRTGDVAYLDDDGFLYIVDRIKDLIIRGGENIGCGLVEAALLLHPDVHEAAVYAVPDERLGEEVGATLYGNPELDLDALREFLNGQLARFAVPRYIVRSPAPLQRTPSGKIFKREIRLAALAEIRRPAEPGAMAGS
ncbi:class I adenylate-forming enzyme family protein [Limnohabitans sp. Rim8]|uniref:class I adenylate-forming enzyme family protein n=1 Tax=Limnohabitans sp. Rim8 TaxID=1100718 RepID=UPI00261262D5|nr:class I adenylate-forming enzyme family protein [Limnohabitans sp. Rim8]